MGGVELDVSDVRRYIHRDLSLGRALLGDGPGVGVDLGPDAGDLVGLDAPYAEVDQRLAFEVGVEREGGKAGGNLYDLGLGVRQGVGQEAQEFEQPPFVGEHVIAQG